MSPLKYCLIQKIYQKSIRKNYIFKKVNKSRIVDLTMCCLQGQNERKLEERTRARKIHLQ